MSPPSVIRILGNVDEHGNVIPSQNFYRAWVDLWTRTGGETDNVLAANTTASAASTAAATAQSDLETNNVSVEDLSQIKWSDSSGVWPADDSDDHVLTFTRQGSTIATRTIRAVFTQSSGNWTVTSVGTSGEATTVSITGSGGKDAKAVVTHTGSGIKGKVTLQSINQSASGASPSK